MVDHATCAGCGHVRALHNAAGCRLNGCRCAAMLDLSGVKGPLEAAQLVHPGSPSRLASAIPFALGLATGIAAGALIGIQL